MLKDTMLKKGLSTHIFVYNILDEAIIKQIKDAGFDAIEIWGMRPHFDYKDKERIESLARLLKDNSIKVVSFHAPIYEEVTPPDKRKWLSFSSKDNKNRQKALTETKELIDCMGLFDAGLLVIHGLEDRKETESIKAFHKSLTELAEYCGEKNIRIAVENVLHGATAEKIMRLIDDEKYDPDAVGICLDLGHSNISNNPVNDLEECSERLIALHVSDNNGREDSHGVPFTGTIDWMQVAAVLKKIGFDGYFMYEIRNREDINNTLNKINESFEKIKEGFKPFFNVFAY
ncbi:MAG: sugar phosphate isomerase/epimerase [Nitrospirae bacterium]|nr:sugar phosphate isomerase/epimerase [Nitrospirota bacterium]